SGATPRSTLPSRRETRRALRRAARRRDADGVQAPAACAACPPRDAEQHARAFGLQASDLAAAAHLRAPAPSAREMHMSRARDDAPSTRAERTDDVEERTTR